MFREGPGRSGSIHKHADKRVLLVEDSRMFSTVLKHGLETAHGLKVTHCSSLSALKASVEGSSETFALAVLDLNLPDGPNCEALDYIISRDIAAIVFTGLFNDKTRGEILSRNVVDCVIKNQPGSIDEVISAVDRVLTNSGTSVVLVDSQAASREALLDILRQQRFQVTCAVSGAEALAVLESRAAPGLLITDDTLSDMTGTMLMDALQQRYGHDMCPVFGLADAPDRLAAARFLQAGGTDFMAKPFAVEEFISRISRIASVQNRLRLLHNIAARDYLTELYNRRHFFQHGPRMVDLCLRRGQSTSIAILDIDHFKRLNDTYGHEVGDLVLKAVAARLRALVGDNHMLARLGGEEFGILFDGLDVHAAHDFCETLLVDLSKAKVVADDEELTVTVSIGLATIEGRETFDNYLNAADQFLYMAKYAGRNRIVSELTLLKTMAG